MTNWRFIRSAIALCSVIGGCSWLARLGNDQRMAAANADLAKLPFMRRIDQRFVRDFGEPATWFAPKQVLLRYAGPVPGADGRFALMTIREGRDDEATVIDVSCRAATVRTFKPDQSEGDLLTNRDGTIYQMADGRTLRAAGGIAPITKSQRRAFCEDDWMKERRAIEGLKTAARRLHADNTSKSEVRVE